MTNTAESAQRTSRLLFAATIPVTIQAFLVPYARRFRAMGYVVDAAANGAGRQSALLSEFDHLWDVPWKRNPLHPSNLVAFAKFYRELRRRNYTVVHLHTPVAAFFGRAAIAAFRGDRPVAVYTAHGFAFTPESRGLGARVFRRLEQIAARWTDLLIVLTREDEEQALAIGYPRDRVVRIPGIGVDTSYFEASRVALGDLQLLRRHLRIRESTALFVCIGEFIPRKRQADLIRALALVGEDVHVAFAGDGPTEQQVRATAAQLGLSGRAHFLGNLQDVRPLMVLATAVVLPSEREGLPRSLLEAMSLGTPILATDIRGSRDLAGVAGLVVPVGDVPALANAMRTLASDRDLRRHLAVSGRAAVLATYDFEVVAAQHDAIYAQVLKAHSMRKDQE